MSDHVAILTSRRGDLVPGGGRLTLEDPPPGAPPCDVCGRPANLEVDVHAYCRRCLAELVTAGRGGLYPSRCTECNRATNELMCQECADLRPCEECDA